MAVYKVPQDVEAEDKLIGPFGFRQFIYLLIAAGCGGLTFLLFKAPLPIPMFSVFTIPPAVALVLLALPLKKDQPMEIYIAAIIRFWLKPKKRLWRNGGIASISTVIIDAPAVIQKQLARDISQEQALDQLGQLSRIVDTHGWAAKGVDLPEESFVEFKVQDDEPGVEDVLDENAKAAKSFDNLLAQQKQQSRDDLMERMKGGAQTATATAAPSAASTVTQPEPLGATGAPPAAPTDEAARRSQEINPTGAAQATYDNRGTSFKRDGQGVVDEPLEDQPQYNPYPKMHQQVLSPLDRLQPRTFHGADKVAQEGGTMELSKNDTAAPEPQQTQSQPNNDNKEVTPGLSPDTIKRLAEQSEGLSVASVANQARREQQREESEVVVDLR